MLLLLLLLMLLLLLLLLVLNVVIAALLSSLFGNKMRLHHFGCAMNQVFGPLTVFHTHNYADNYSPEIVALQSSGQAVAGHLQNILMPTLREMHKSTAASPRSTATLFLLLEELSYRRPHNCRKV